MYITKLDYYYNLLQNELDFSNQQINILKGIIDYLLINFVTSNNNCENRVENNINAILEYINKIKLTIIK